MSKLKAYLMETRAPFLTVTIIPVLLGTFMAKSTGVQINWLIFTYAMLGFIFLHLGTNVLNDYFDNKNGTDVVNKDFVAPFTGGSRLIQNGILAPKEVLIEGIIFMVAGSALFIPLIMNSGMNILYILSFVLVSGIFYTAPPFKFAHTGAGELFIFANFGPVMVLTSYFVQTGSFAIAPLMASLPIGLLTAAIIDVNEFPDYKADKETGKNNLTVRLGKKNGVTAYIVMVVLAYVALIVATVMNYLPLWSLVGLLTLIVAIKAISELKANFEKPQELTKACGMTIATHLLTGIIIIITIML